MDGPAHCCPPEAARAELRRILESPEFEASERNRRFLEYVVEEALAGRALRIKAYSVATEVFRRDESFDPQMDPIVRIEASRLRRALERYYLTAGVDDPLRILIPKGAYAPAFVVGPAGEASREDLPEIAPETQVPPPAPVAASPRSGRIAVASAGILGLVLLVLAAASLGGLPPFGATSAEAPSVRHGPAIFVASFAEDGDSLAFPNFTPGFTRAVIVGLTRFNDLFVFGPETTLRYDDKGDLQKLVADLGVDFVLTGGATVSGERFAVDALLIDARTGQYVWASRFEGALDPEDIFRARDDVANRVARSLAQPYGVIFTNRVTETEGKPPEWLSSYDCVVRFYKYWKSYRRDDYPEVRACLEQAVESDPEYAEAYAALSLTYADAYRFEFDSGASASDPRQSALALARRAIELVPDTARGYHALSLAYWLMNDVERSLDAARTGLARNPNDTELMSELGMRLCWRLQWETGLALLREAYARNPGQPTGYRLALFMDHYLHGRYREALAEAKKIEAPHIVYGHLVVAMASTQLGLDREARAAVDRILAIDPAYADHVVEDLAKRNIHPDLISVVVNGLRKAGLPVVETPTPQKS